MSPCKQHLVLIGYPLGHSISPAFQQAALDHIGLPAEYTTMPVPPALLAQALDGLRGSEFLGANVTIPHKEAAMRHLDGIDPWASSIGAVNTIVKDGSNLVGHNTDAYGFMTSLKEKAGFDPKGSTALLLGAGGAARAAAFALAQEGVASLTIANRTLGRAQSLAGEVAEGAGTVSALSMTDAALAIAVRDADLIVNATSIGMRHSPEEAASPIEGELIRPGSIVYDMVYTPEDTPLLAAAKEAGASTLGGLWMLVLQGAAAFELWTGKFPPVDVMHNAAQDALASQGRPNRT